MNIYNCIQVREQTNALFVRIYRPEANNSINALLIRELLSVLKHYEGNNAIRVVILEGMPDNFCTGMDFRATGNTGQVFDGGDPAEYYELLKRFTISSKIIISLVEGKVNAGGIGLVAASDIVIAGEKATFGLSEALFGLLPACVMPFLIRRIGFQKSQWMTLITQGIPVQRALQLGLVDETGTDINDILRKNLLRLTRLQSSIVKELKSYMNKLWIIDDQTKQLAVDKITSLMSSEKVQTGIREFVQNGKFPWDR